jgi:hypothetical protein
MLTIGPACGLLARHQIDAAALARASRVGLYSLKPEKGKVDELKAWLLRTPQEVC